MVAGGQSGRFMDIRYLSMAKIIVDKDLLVF